MVLEDGFIGLPVDVEVDHTDEFLVLLPDGEEL